MQHISKWERAVLQFYVIISRLNRIIISLIFSVSYFSISFYPQFENRIGSFIISYCASYLLSELIYQLAKKRYLPRFTNKETMNYADWIDHHIGPKQHHDLLDNKTYKYRYSFELDLLTFLYTGFFLFILAALYGFITKLTQLQLPFIFRLESITNLIPLGLTYLISLCLLFLSTSHISLNVKEKRKDWDITFLVTMGLLTACSFIVFFYLLLYLALHP